MKPQEYKMIVLDGWINDVSGHLPDYFYREFKKAEQVGISWEEFYKNLKEVIKYLQTEIDKPYNQQLILWNEYLIQQSHRGIPTEIKMPKKEDFRTGIPLLYLSDSKYTSGHFFESDLRYIETAIANGCIRLLKEKGIFTYDVFEELFNDAVLFEDIPKPVNEHSRLVQVSLHSMQFNDFLHKIKNIDESNYSECLTRNIFKEYLDHIDNAGNNGTEHGGNVKLLDISKIKNNFDAVKITEVYEHFKTGLVEKGYFSDSDLINFLIAAFNKKETPQTLFKLQDVQSKQKIIKVFSTYYKNIAGKPHGRQKEYAGLLGDYFQGYNTNNVSTNFSK